MVRPAASAADDEPSRGPDRPVPAGGSLDVRVACVTLCHLKAISIRQLHDETGRWVRRAKELGELAVTERGQVVAKIVPANEPPPQPYFASRRLLPSFRAAKLTGGTDATVGISQERDER